MIANVRPKPLGDRPVNCPDTPISLKDAKSQQSAVHVKSTTKGATRMPAASADPENPGYMVQQPQQSQQAQQATQPQQAAAVQQPQQVSAMQPAHQLQQAQQAPPPPQAEEQERKQQQEDEERRRRDQLWHELNQQLEQPQPQPSMRRQSCVAQLKARWETITHTTRKAPAPMGKRDRDMWESQGPITTPIPAPTPFSINSRRMSLAPFSQLTALTTPVAKPAFLPAPTSANSTWGMQQAAPYHEGQAPDPNNILGALNPSEHDGASDPSKHDGTSDASNVTASSPFNHRRAADPVNDLRAADPADAPNETQADEGRQTKRMKRTHTDTAQTNSAAPAAPTPTPVSMQPNSSSLPNLSIATLASSVAAMATSLVKSTPAATSITPNVTSTATQEVFTVFIATNDSMTADTAANNAITAASATATTTTATATATQGNSTFTHNTSSAPALKHTPTLTPATATTTTTTDAFTSTTCAAITAAVATVTTTAASSDATDTVAAAIPTLTITTATTSASAPTPANAGGRTTTAPPPLPPPPPPAAAATADIAHATASTTAQVNSKHSKVSAPVNPAAPIADVSKPAAKTAPATASVGAVMTAVAAPEAMEATTATVAAAAAMTTAHTTRTAAPLTRSPTEVPDATPSSSTHHPISHTASNIRMPQSNHLPTTIHEDTPMYDDVTLPVPPQAGLVFSLKLKPKPEPNHSPTTAPMDTSAPNSSSQRELAESSQGMSARKGIPNASASGTGFSSSISTCIAADAGMLAGTSMGAGVSSGVGTAVGPDIGGLVNNGDATPLVKFTIGSNDQTGTRGHTNSSVQVVRLQTQVAALTSDYKQLTEKHKQLEKELNREREKQKVREAQHEKEVQRVQEREREALQQVKLGEDKRCQLERVIQEMTTHRETLMREIQQREEREARHTTNFKYVVAKKEAIEAKSKETDRKLQDVKNDIHRFRQELLKTEQAKEDAERARAEGERHVHLADRKVAEAQARETELVAELMRVKTLAKNKVAELQASLERREAQISDMHRQLQEQQGANPGQQGEGLGEVEMWQTDDEAKVKIAGLKHESSVLRSQLWSSQERLQQVLKEIEPLRRDREWLVKDYEEKLEMKKQEILDLRETIAECEDVAANLEESLNEMTFKMERDAKRTREMEDKLRKYEGPGGLNGRVRELEIQLETLKAQLTTVVREKTDAKKLQEKAEETLRLRVDECYELDGKYSVLCDELHRLNSLPCATGHMKGSRLWEGKRWRKDN